MGYSFLIFFALLSYNLIVHNGIILFLEKKHEKFWRTAKIILPFQSIKKRCLAIRMEPNLGRMGEWLKPAVC